MRLVNRAGREPKERRKIKRSNAETTTRVGLEESKEAIDTNTSNRITM
jgi:hypothetical protein